MNRLLQAGSLAGAIVLAALVPSRAGTPATYGVAPGMTQSAALAALAGVARCEVEKQLLDEGALPAGTYQLYTTCRLNDGRGTLALRTTSSLTGERIAEVDFMFHSPDAGAAVAETLARDYGVVPAAAEHVGGEWLWRLSEHVDLTLFVYPGSDGRSAVLRDTALQRQDLLARKANSAAAAIGAAGERG